MNARDLDNYITGHYGEDQFKQSHGQRLQAEGEITPNAAKKIIKAELDKRGLPYTKLSAKTIGFSDLARAACIFVKIHGWQPNPQWDELKTIAKENGFRID